MGPSILIGVATEEVGSKEGRPGSRDALPAMTSAKRSRAVLLLSRSVAPTTEVVGRLGEAGISVLDNPEGPDLGGDRLAARLSQSDGVFVGNQDLDARLLESAPRLRVIVKTGAGLDNLDLVAAERLGIAVASLPGLNAEAVADHAFGMLLAVARRLLEADALVRGGGWGRLVGTDVHGKTLGLIGLGAVGRAVARRARGFSMPVLGHDPALEASSAAELGVELVKLDRLLEEADFISLHAPLMASTHHLFSAAALELVKPGAIIINTARGGLIDERELARALDQGRLAGAGLDVFEAEPPVGSPLLGRPNVLLSPHNASYTAECLAQVSATAVERMIELLDRLR